ncbi:MAG: PhoH-like ATPase [Gammaproteobacteria bacterium]|jgi:PhoH-like ATPase
MTATKRLYVLDANVLIHDPMALLRFEEHDVFVPLQVLEELDQEMRGVTDLARNVRKVSTLLDEIIGDAGADEIARGLPLPGSEAVVSARLFLETRPAQPVPHSPFGTDTADNRILNCALSLADSSGDGDNHRTVILISRNINLRIKARSLGLTAEDYHSDRVIEDLSLLPRGLARASSGVLDADNVGKHFAVNGEFTRDWHPHLGLYDEQNDKLDARVVALDSNTAQLERLVDFQLGSAHQVWGIQARNREQNFALNLLMDPQVDLVTLLGAAGTGKTLLTLAAGLAQTLDSPIYKEIIVTRATIAVGDDIGFLPGTEEEKMTPWMGALMDNLEVLSQPDADARGGEWGRAATNDLINQRIKLRSLSFMRGRTFLNRFVIIDEAQNLSRMQMKTLITRAGPGSKVVCMGNIAQIDAPYISATTSGLTFAVDRFRPWAHAGHVTLARGERSRLADFANEAL